MPSPILFVRHHRPFGSVRSTSSSAVDSLLAWLRTAGGDVSGVHVSFAEQPASSSEPDAARSSSSLGLVAAQSAAAGCQLALLPAACQLSYSPSELPAPLRRLLEAVPEPLWAARLGLVLLEERARGDASHFAAYVDLLPRRFSTPLFWSGAAVASLQYPPLQAQVTRRCRFLAAFAGGPLSQHAFSGQACDSNALGWALSACSSRAFRLRGDAAPPSLLPLIDFANHCSAPNAEVVLAAGGAAALRALHDVSAGDELLLNYGALSNDLLLLDYGFVDAANAHDFAALRYSPPLLELAREVAGLGALPFADGAADCQPALWQAALLAELKLEERPELLLGRGGCDPRLLAALRALHCAGAEAPAALRGLSPAAAAAALQSRCCAALLGTAEARALRSAAAVAAVALAQWPTSAEEDEALLRAAGREEEAMCLALAFRAAKKGGLQALIGELKARAAAAGDASS